MYVKEEIPIIVSENNDPLVAVHVNTLTVAGVVANYNFTGVTEIVFIAKAGLATPDANAFINYTMTGGKIAIVSPATDGNLTIQMDKADLDVAGVYRYHIDATKASKIETVMAGLFVIQNV